MRILRTSSLVFLLSLLKYKRDVLTQSVLRNCRINNVWVSVLACDHPRAECWSLWVRHKTPLTSALHFDPPPIHLACVRLITRHLVFLALAWDQAGLYWQDWQTLGHVKETERVRISLLNLRIRITFPCDFSKVKKEAGEEKGNWALAVQPWWAEGRTWKQTACRVWGENLTCASAEGRAHKNLELSQ